MFLRELLDLALAAVNAVLLLLCIVSVLSRRQLAKDGLIVLFCLVSVLFSIASIGNASFGWLPGPLYARLYWAAELFEQGFALTLMVAVMRAVLAHSRSSAITSQILASIFVVVMSALLSEGAMSFGTRWMTQFTRNLSFGVAILNFQVWGTILRERSRSRKVLLLAAGLGLLTTGKSLGHTVRLVAAQSGWLNMIGGYIVVITSILASAAWLYAVRTPPQPAGRSKENGPQLVKAA